MILLKEVVALSLKPFPAHTTQYNCIYGADEIHHIVNRYNKNLSIKQIKNETISDTNQKQVILLKPVTVDNLEKLLNEIAL